MQNGVVDLRTGKLRPGKQQDRITKQAPVVFDAAATCPTFDEFLRRVQPDPSMRDYLQRRAGYALTGITTAQDMLFFLGTGANGKTTFVNAIQAMLGSDYAKQAAPGLLLRRHTDRQAHEIADLEGARLVVSSEIDDGGSLAEGLLKRLTGNEPLKGRLLYMDYVEFEPTFKVVLVANHKPIIRGTDWAIWRRIKLVPWSVTIPQDDIDPDLPDRLRAEVAGILNWAIRGCLAWQREGFEEPNAVKSATAEYKSDSDILGQFIADCIICDPRFSAPASLLYARYQRWAIEQGHTGEIMSATAFGRRMGERFERRATRSGNVYEGLRIRNDGGGFAGERRWDS